MNCPHGHQFIDGRCANHGCGISQKVCDKAREHAEAYVYGSAYLTPEQLAERIEAYENKKRRERTGDERQHD